MRFDWWTFALQTVNVLILLWILSRFLFRPAADIIKARQAEAGKLLSDAAAARESAEAERRKAAAFEQELSARRAEALHTAEQDASARGQALIDAARKEAEQLRQAARVAIAQAREAEAEAADDRASRLAVDIAAKLIDRMPESARVAGFIEGLVEAVAALPLETRVELAAEGAPIPVTAPRALAEIEIGELEAGLRRALGRVVRVQGRIDAGLIAGLEIETAHARVRNSLRADLEAIQNKLLTRDG